MASALQLGNGVAALALLSAGDSARPRPAAFPRASAAWGSLANAFQTRAASNTRILEWKEQRRLCFEMTDSDMFFRTHVRAIVDSFDLEAVGTDRTRVTRTTEVVLVGRCRTSRVRPSISG